jgi:hypothetical protein
MSDSKEKKVHASDLHFEHVLWKNQLSFYKDELKLLQKRLEEVSAKNTSPEMKVKQGHFQDQIVIQQNEIHELNHLFESHESGLASLAQENPVAFDHKLFHDHSSIHERMERFVKLYSEFKTELMRFVSVWI